VSASSVHIGKVAWLFMEWNKIMGREEKGMSVIMR